MPIPDVLLSISLESATKKDAIKSWRQAGISGVLLPMPFEPGTAPMAETPAGQDGPEVLSPGVPPAVEHLKASGMPNVFLLASIAQENRYYAAGTAREEALLRLTEVMHLACEMHLPGVAVDSASAGLFQDPLWDGYREPLGEIEEGARAFGVALVRAWARAYPSGEVLLIGEGPARTGPLWYQMMAGMIHEMRRREMSALHLLVREHAGDPPQMAVRAERVHQTINLHLPGEDRRWWHTYGSIGLHLGPQGEEGSPISTLACKLFSDRYVWTEQSRGPISGTQTPVDACMRIGPIEVQGGPAYVVRGGRGAGLILWHGCNKPIPVGERVESVPVIRLADGQTTYARPDGETGTIGPFSEGVFLDRLSMWQWATPACLWMEPAMEGSHLQGFPLSFGFSNRTGFPIEGTLLASGSSGIAISPSTHPLLLGEGDDLVIEGRLAGSDGPGTVYEVALQGMAAGASSFSRTFHVTHPPRLCWKTAVSGPITGPPLVEDLDRDGHMEIIVATQAGVLVCLDSSGREQWRTWVPGRFDMAVACLRDNDGTPRLAALDRHGVLRMMDARGAVEWALPAGPSGSILAISAGPGETKRGLAIVGLDTGRIVAHAADGATGWQVESLGYKPRITQADISGDGQAELLVTTEDGSRRIHCLTSGGQPMWSARAALVPSCAPAVADLDEDGAPEVLIGASSGLVQIRDGFTGIALDESEAASCPVLGLATVEPLVEDGPEVLVATQAGLYALSSRLESRWLIPIACTGPPAALRTAHGSYVLVPTAADGLVWADSGGRILWRDPQPSAPVAAPPVICDLDGDSLPEGIVATGDSEVFALSFH